MHRGVEQAVLHRIAIERADGMRTLDAILFVELPVAPLVQMAASVMPTVLEFALVQSASDSMGRSMAMRHGFPSERFPRTEPLPDFDHKIRRASGLQQFSK